MNPACLNLHVDVSAARFLGRLEDKLIPVIPELKMFQQLHLGR